MVEGRELLQLPTCPSSSCTGFLGLLRKQLPAGARDAQGAQSCSTPASEGATSYAPRWSYPSLLPCYPSPLDTNFTLRPGLASSGLAWAAPPPLLLRAGEWVEEDSSACPPLGMKLPGFILLGVGELHSRRLSWPLRGAAQCVHGAGCIASPHPKFSIT